VGSSATPWVHVSLVCTARTRRLEAADEDALERKSAEWIALRSQLSSVERGGAGDGNRFASFEAPGLKCCEVWTIVRVAFGLREYSARARGAIYRSGDDDSLVISTRARRPLAQRGGST